MVVFLDFYPHLIHENMCISKIPLEIFCQRISIDTYIDRKQTHEACISIPCKSHIVTIVPESCDSASDWTIQFFHTFSFGSWILLPSNIYANQGWIFSTYVAGNDILEFSLVEKFSLLVFSLSIWNSNILEECNTAFCFTDRCEQRSLFNHLDQIAENLYEFWTNFVKYLPIKKLDNYYLYKKIYLIGSFCFQNNYEWLSSKSPSISVLVY